MPVEKAVGLVIRTYDWSETSRIAVMYTRSLGKVRVLAKGGRRLKSSFEVALDLLTVCSIVFARKSSGGLDLLMEARVEERFGGLRRDLKALYGGYYIAELLQEGTQEYDPHPGLYDRALATLRRLSAGEDVRALASSFELGWLTELGLRPELDRCVVCGGPMESGPWRFSATAGGLVCGVCTPPRDHQPISPATVATLRRLQAGALPPVTAEVRQVLAGAVCTVLGKKPKMLSYWQ